MSGQGLRPCPRELVDITDDSTTNKEALEEHDGGNSHRYGGCHQEIELNFLTVDCAEGFEADRQRTYLRGEDTSDRRSRATSD